MSQRVGSLALLVLVCLPLAAQVDHASLSGTVTDASGALVQGARVDTVSVETGFRRQTVTGSGGTYQIPGLPIGSYTVTFSKEGFKPTEFKGVELVVGQPRTIDATPAGRRGQRYSRGNRGTGDAQPDVAPKSAARWRPRRSRKSRSTDGTGPASCCWCRARSTTATAGSAPSSSTAIRSTTATSSSTASTPAACRSRPRRPTRA